MTRLSLALAASLLLVAAGCGSSSQSEQSARPCDPAPHELKGPPSLLPASFPTPPDVAYTAARRQGRATLAAAFLSGSARKAHDAYAAALPKAGYTVTRQSRSAGRAEVDFSGSGRKGQVKMIQVCDGRTNLTITIRPS